jgi:hypothetical protein
MILKNILAKIFGQRLALMFKMLILTLNNKKNVAENRQK